MKKIVPIIFYVILSCLVPVVFCTASYAQIETPLRIPITPEEIQIGKVDWYGVYIQGEKIGYSTISISYDSDDLCYLVKQKYHMKLKSLNQKLDTITETLLKFKDKPPYAFLHAISTTSINSINKSSVEVAKSDDGFKVIVSSGGEKQIKNIPIIDYTLEDLLTPEQWIKQSPNIGDKISTRLFDNSFLKPYIDPKSHITNYNLALSYVQLQNYEEAILCLQKAVALKPDYVDAYCERGKTYVKLKKYNDAIKQLRKAVEINPDHYSSNLNLGRAYGESGSLEESIESLKKAIEINRNDPLVWNNLGYTYYLKRMYKKAIEQYETGLTISSEDPLTHYNKALAHVSLKEFADAFKHFNHAADLGYPVKPSLLKDIETLLQHSEK